MRREKKRETDQGGQKKIICSPLFLVLDICRMQPVLKLISKFILSLFRELSAFSPPNLSLFSSIFKSGSRGQLCLLKLSHICL